MSRERALRRAERQRLAEDARARRERQRLRRQRRQAALDAVRQRLPRRTRWGRHRGLLAHRRRMQNALLLGLFLVSQAIVWLIWSDPWIRAAAAVFGVLAMPVVVTLAFDRRS